MEKEKIKTLIEAGRDIAADLIKEISQEAKTSDQLTDVMIVLEAAAVTLIATMAFNYKKQHGTEFEKYIRSFNRLVAELYDFYTEEDKVGKMVNLKPELDESQH